MDTSLRTNVAGGYRFLPGIEPYCCGVVSQPGWEIVHATLDPPIPWRAGLHSIRQYLETNDRSRHALCGVELRCPEPFSMDNFINFNHEYRLLLEEWGLLVDGDNPVARTNVAPVESPPDESVIYGFSYTEPSTLQRPTFVIAGSGELRGRLDTDHILRCGETSEDALRDKARCVVEIMNERLVHLGNNESLTTVDVYTAHGYHQALMQCIIPGLPAVARLGTRWFYSRPPIQNIEFEMDMRGVRQELEIHLT